jgi:MFS family permease
MVAFALGGITLSSWGPRLGGIRDGLGLGDGGLGLVLAGVTVGSIAGLGASSALLATLGARRAIAAVLCLMAAGLTVVAAGAGLAHSVPLTVVGFMVVGFAVGALDVAINVEANGVEQAAGRTLMPLMHAAWSAGAIIGAAIGAAATALGIPFEQQFFAEAALVVIVALIAPRSIPLAAPVHADVVREPMGARIRGWARGWGDGRLLLIGVVMLGVELGEGSANTWLVLAVRDGHREPETVATLFFVAFAIGETAARVFGGPLVDRVGRVRAVRVTTALGVVGMLLFILAPAAPLVLVGTVLWSVGVSMGFPLGMSAAADSGPNAAARVSVVASIGYLASLAGPPLIGFLSQGFGLLNALWAVALLLAVGFVLAGALRVRASTTAASPTVDA